MARRWLVVGLIGFLVRVLYMWNGRDDPAFLHPIVDAKTYHDLARGFALTGWSERFLWQAAFFPAFLTAVYQVCGVSVLAVKIVHAVIGGITCALSAQLGQMVSGRRAGWVAGLLVAFCGPLIFFESRLLATAWAALWAVALAVLLLRNLARPGPVPLMAMGVVLALAVYTRPTFLPVGAVMLILLLMRSPEPALAWRRRLGSVALVALGFLLIAGPVSLFFRQSTGHWGLLPPSGGINLHIGNNPRYAETINIRPGLAWARLVAEPQSHGYAADPWSGDRYFKNRVREFAWAEPGRFLAGLGDKTLTLVSSREMPRNLDIYLHRQWSPLLATLTWKVGAWGFPWGLLFPLAVVGLARPPGRQARALAALLGVLAATLVLVFVSARYRAPLLPLVAVFAAGGLMQILAAVQRRQLPDLAVIAALVLGGVVLSTVPGPFAQEPADLEAELYFGIAENLYDQEEWAAAVPHLERSLSLDSEVHAAHQVMGICLAHLQEYDRAMTHFQKALQLWPEHQATQFNLQNCRQDRARVRFLAGRSVETTDPLRALQDFEVASGDMPNWYKPIARKAYLLATCRLDSIRDGAAAVQLARRALALRNTPDAYLQYVLAAALAESGQYEAALIAAREALQLVPVSAEDAMGTQIRQAMALFAVGQPLRRE
jgi:4-amino-4-deoxy-L-arabinose transferase-like glycosyltransferase